MAGYSPKPLAAKLGIKPGMRLCVIGAPMDYTSLTAPLPAGVRLSGQADATTDFVHLFTTREAMLAETLHAMVGVLPPTAMIWVSWPKQASKQPSEIGEDDVRRLALPLGWVDIKVCAVDEVWSGLKLVRRKALR